MLNIGKDSMQLCIKKTYSVNTFYSLESENKLVITVNEEFYRNLIVDYCMILIKTINLFQKMVQICS